jgi:hypothetical protein
MIFDPVDKHVSDLPFVNALAGFSFQEHVLQSFAVSCDPDREQIVLLHLHSKSGPVLLEMVVNIVVSDSEPHAVLTGREVDSELATLIASKASESGTSSTISWASDRCFVAGLSDSRTESPSGSAIARGEGEGEGEGSDLSERLSDEERVRRIAERGIKVKLQTAWKAKRRSSASIMMTERSIVAAAPLATHVDRIAADGANVDYVSISSGSTVQARHDDFLQITENRSLAGSN